MDTKRTTALRAHAEHEARMRGRQSSEDATETADHLLHELQVHQIELEMQNEELRRANAALAASQELYYRLYDLAPVGYLTLDAAGLITETNLAAAALVGIEPNELIRQPWTRFIAAEDQDTYYLHRRAAAGTPEGFSCELALRTKDARPRWVRMEVRPAPGSAPGDPACWATLSDVTERRQTEQALSELQGDLASLHDGGSIATLVVDPQLHGRALHGRTAATSGDPIIDRVEHALVEALRSHHETHAGTGEGSERCGECAVRAAVRRTFDQQHHQQQVEVTLHFAPADGGTEARTFLLSTAYLTMKPGPRVLVCTVDVTERRRLAAELAQAQKLQAIGQLAGGVAHEFNNMLAVILFNAELLERVLAPGSDAASELRAIVGAGHRARDVTRQLLAYGRKPSTPTLAMDIRPAVMEMETLLRTYVRAEIALCIELAEDLAAVRIDPAQLEQVLVNLVVNARDSIAAAGEIRIRADNVEVGADDQRRLRSLAPGMYLRLQVADTGCGLPAHATAHIFEPFFTTKPQGQGTGLGLAVVHGIITQSGGHIEVVSEPDRGTTFSLYLPRAIARITTAPVPEPVRAPAAFRGWGKVLMVEDEPVLRKCFDRLLRGMGFEVEAAANGQEALERFTRDPEGFRFVLTDLAMPLMSGVELARQLEARRPALRILFMSGNPDEVMHRDSASRSSPRLLTKPFSPDELVAAVEALLTPDECSSASRGTSPD